MKPLFTILIALIGFSVNAQETKPSNDVNPKNLVATLRNDTLFVHKDIPEFADFESATPYEVAYNKFRKVNFYREKTIWFFYVVYDYGLAYVGVNKGGREIYDNALGGRVKYLPRGF